MPEVRHVTFNPSTALAGYSPLTEICRANQAEGWALVRVVPHHQYEAVAVLERTLDNDGTPE
jgi:hypothetical protein